MDPSTRAARSGQAVTSPVGRWRWRLAEVVASALLVWVGLHYWLTYFDRGTNLLDEGSQAAQAARILRGDLIYRDFLTVVTPGSYYTVAWLFRVFGPDLMVLRWLALAIGLGIMIATLAIARHLVSWPFAATSAMLTVVWGWFLVAPNLYSWQAMFFALLALLCYLRYVWTSRALWLLASGLATGLSVLVKQNTGIYAGVGLLLTIWISTIFEDASPEGRSLRARATAVFVVGIGLCVVPVLVALLVSGAGPNLYENWIHYPRIVYARGLSLPYPSFYPILPQPGLETLGQAMAALLAGRIPEPAVFEVWTKFVLYLPVLVYPVALISLVVLLGRWTRTSDADIAREGQTLLAITLFGAFTFLQAWPRSDVTHILFGMQPGFILLGYLSFCVWRGLRKVPFPALHAVVALATLLPQAALLRNGYKLTVFQNQNYDVPLRAARARGIFTSREEQVRIDGVTEYIAAHTALEDPIFVVPWAAGFYFLADRPNPTRVDLLFDGDPDAYPCLIATLDLNKPKYVIYGYVWDVDGKRFSEYARPIDTYIRARYRIETTFPGYEIWRRLDDEAPILGIRSDACRPPRLQPMKVLRSLQRRLLPK